MEKRQRDLNWKCLPKGTRDFIKCQLKAKSNCPDFDEGYDQALIDLFGKPNLESDTEPEEMLMIERQRVQNMYDYNDDILLTDPTHKGAKLLAAKLKELFGDKCLPDKDESGQREPKFKVRDKVKIKNEEIASVIDAIKRMPDGSFFYELHNIEPSVRESDLEPYTEPETKDMEEKNNLKEIFTKENFDEIVSSMLEYTAVITQDVITEAAKYKPEEERIFIKGAAWMLYHLVKNRGQRHIYIDSDMSLDEAIQHCEEVLPLAETAQCAREHVQLRDWLTELKQYRENKQ